MEGEYQVVFDLSVSGYKAWRSLTPGFIITVIGVLIAFFPGLIHSQVWSRGAVRAWGWVIGIFAAILSAVSMWTNYSEYSELALPFKRDAIA